MYRNERPPHGQSSPSLEPINIDLVYATKGLDLALVDQLGRLIAAELEALFADT